MDEIRQEASYLGVSIPERYSLILVQTDVKASGAATDWNEDLIYFVSENIYADIDKVEINLVSIYRKNEENFKPDGFIRRFVEKHYRFLKDYVKENEILPENATLIIEAHSKENKNAEARGGYVWATYGFEFLDVHELNQVRLRFKNFAAQRGVDIALKDLAYFKYPCHFAAFRCAQNGQIHDLGKEFLLQDTWLGKISASISTKSEPYRYAKAYHEKNKKAAEKELSRPFLRMMNRYTKQNKMKDIFLSLRGLKKQRC